MKKLLILLLLLGRLVTVLAQEPSARPVENRFLFVIETSSAMGRAAKAAQQTVRDLIESGVQGRMLPGDTLGIWTFNDRLDAGFPMQQWVPGESKKLASTAADFLKKRRYEKKVQMPAVLTPLFSVMKSSRAITVIFISTGNEAIQGTPFDKEINSTFTFYARDLREAKLPFVSVFVGRNGRMVAHAVNSALGPIQIPRPPIPPEPVLVQTNAPAATNKLIAATNTIVTPPKFAKSNIIITKTIVTNPLVATNATVMTNEAGKIETPAPVAETNSKIVSSPEATNKTSTSITNPIETQAVQVTSSIADPKDAYEDTSTFKPQTQEVGDLPQPKFRLRPDGSHNTAPIEPSVTATQNNFGIRQAPVTATQPTNSPKKFLFIGVLFLAVAGILIFFVMRSSRNRSQPSIISRSMDERK